MTRVEQLEREVDAARSSLYHAERTVEDYTYRAHNARLILREKEDALALARYLEAEEQPS